MRYNSDGMEPFICIIQSKMEKKDTKSNKFFSWDTDLSIHSSRSISDASSEFLSQSSIYHLHLPNVRYVKKQTTVYNDKCWFAPGNETTSGVTSYGDFFFLSVFKEHGASPPEKQMFH